MDETVGGARDGDWVLLTFLQKSQGLVKKHSYYAGCVHFTVEWLFWNLYGCYIAPRPLLSLKRW